MRDLRSWDGKTVHVAPTDPTHDRRCIDVALTTETASELANSLARLRQTTFALPDGIQELLDALNYVLVGDPYSTSQHQRMEAGKGMTPDGGYRAPDLIQHPYVDNPANPGFCHASSEVLGGKHICWQPRAAHYAEGALGEREVNP